MSQEVDRAGGRLGGRVALVAGATRGTGRGIARALGEAGAVVYCTGRSARNQPSPYKRPETIEETAELVTAAGGTAVAVRVDHTVETDVGALIARIKKAHGRLDVLTLSIAGEDPTLSQAWRAPLEKIEMDKALSLIRQAVLSHLLTVKHAASLMTLAKPSGAKGGLIVEVTEGDTLVGGYSILHGLVKQSLKMLAFMYADHFRKHRIAAVAVTPGFLRSEAMLEHFGVSEANWRDGAKKDKNFLQSETPLLIGRAIAALAADERRMDHTGEVTSSWELAARYDVVDADGRRPDWGAHFEAISREPQYKWLKDAFARETQYLDRIARRASAYAGLPHS
jgi:NAD(P)-dependent dehydrogenase (short-subunit alcohol dehydrogenase family)